MGAAQDKCTVAALNYSGIYLSPFQYYGIDNWQELEKIGKIFQQQLKAYYSEIKKQSIGLGNKSNFADQYDRRTFKWDLGKIDKDIHNERYSPLYTSVEDLKKGNFAGISKKQGSQTLMNQIQFKQKWVQIFEGIKAKKSSSQQVIKTSTQSRADQKYQCCMLDFLSYKSIILYLIANSNKQNQLYIDYRRSYIAKSFQDIITSRDLEKQKQIISAYRKLMRTYFKRIDTKTKIQRTIKQFFGRNGPEVIILVEATKSLRDEISKKKNEYQIYGPFQTKVKQTLLLVKKNLPFKTIYDNPDQYADFNDKYRAGLSRILRNAIQKQNIQMSKKDFEKFIECYFKGTIKTELDKQLSSIGQDSKRTIKQLRQIFEFYVAEPIKCALQIQLRQFLPKLQEILIPNLRKHFKDKESQMKEAAKFFQELKQKGFMSWATDVTFAQLQEKIGDKKEVIFGGFHLASNPAKNYVQIQILGLIIYHLLKTKSCKIVFAGDFNSYLSLVNRDNHVCMFEFVKENFRQSNPDSIIKQINIFPQHSKIITTKKKRTILQAQTKKANEMTEKCIDQILTNYEFKSSLSHVCEIGDTGTRKTDNECFLPHLEHPYDHYLVQTTLDLLKRPY